MLTVRSATVSGRGFSMRTAPAAILAAGASGTMQVSFVAPARGKRHQGRIHLFTNDPATPVFLLRVAASVR
jgi:hypothetical protein